ncbi:MAG: response regulator [Woeseiaceae bacterium]|nr:response regulator [Woeseiaceae bacterium]
MRKKIAFLEDDEVIRENYTELLRAAGFEVSAFGDTESAEKDFERELPDLALLDLKIDNDEDAGLNVCLKLRRLSRSVPVVFLTSYAGDSNKIDAFRYGADDYITKDASPDLIIVRIKALFRRLEAQASMQEAAFRNSSLNLDKTQSAAYWKGQIVNLALTQYWMLEELVRQPGHVLSHSELMKAGNIMVEPNTVVAHVKAMRDAFKLIDTEFSSIKTERGRGYRWIE